MLHESWLGALVQGMLMGVGMMVAMAAVRGVRRVIARRVGPLQAAPTMVWWDRSVGGRSGPPRSAKQPCSPSRMFVTELRRDSAAGRT
jgi:hypothetical protein